VNDPNPPANDSPKPGPEARRAAVDFSDPHSPLAPSYLTASHVVAAALIGLAAFLLCIIPLFYTDVWGHLAYGRQIAESGALPEYETLNAFTASDAPLGHFQWLSQLLFWGVFRVGELAAGGEGIRALEGGVVGLRSFTLLVGLCYAWFMLLALRRAAASMPIAVGGLLLLFLLAWTTTIRPQILGQLCFAVLLWLLSNPAPRRRLLLQLPILFTVWANMHGSFVIGFYLAGLIFLGRVLQSAKPIQDAYASSGWNWRRALRSTEIRLLFAALAVSTFAALLLNPHGPMILPRILALGSHPNISWFDEWQPMELDVSSFIFLRYAAIIVLICVSWWFGRTAIGWPQILVLVGFVFLPWLQVRMLVWWFPLSVWLLMPAWGLVQIKAGKPSFIKTIMVGLLVIVLLPFTPPVRWLLSGRPSSLVTAVHRNTPWAVALQLEDRDLKKPIIPALAKALEENYPDGRFQGAIFATETLGDFFLWQTPDTPVFMYSHVHLFTPEHWRDVLRVRFAEPGWRGVLDKNGINLVVAEAANHGKLLAQLGTDPDWLVIHDGRDPALPLIVALRKTPLPLPAGVVARVKGN